MKRLIIFLSTAILAVSCQAQEESSQDFAHRETQKDSVKPKGQWRVNREVDEHGNIVRYDSIYSWSSSGNNLAELQEINPDSLMAQMRERMRSSFGMMGGDPFAGFFEEDSEQGNPFMDDFFNNDPFESFPNMDAIRKRMEAMMQRHSEAPGFGRPWIPAEPEKAKEPAGGKTEKTTWKHTI
ncbi:hypothetical protein EAX61_08690 [Dokdonia sinensis]|uniref:Lipoprotein n=1 Tax=Dokdonia sinensis TaxID=2479847 RepID=A0A3M0G3M5_9FLAO|nr:hypothetical protein [Dokdonia sinensis]RMB59128.1 hypothetical protein EAX61_08690 [Dokdonia sinensis]